MFYDPDQFWFARELQGWWPLLRQEYLELDASHHVANAADFYLETLVKKNGWTRSWHTEEPSPDGKCLTYMLSYKGMQPDDLPIRMPTTSRLLSRPKGFRLAAISVMRPRSIVASHAHPVFLGRLLTLHLGLDLIPNRSHMHVDCDTREQRAGHVLIFDGSRQHSAVNTSHSDRAVLYIEFCPKTAAFVGS